MSTGLHAEMQSFPPGIRQSSASQRGTASDPSWHLLRLPLAECTGAGVNPWFSLGTGDFSLPTEAPAQLSPSSGSGTGRLCHSLPGSQALAHRGASTLLTSELLSAREGGGVWVRAAWPCLFRQGPEQPKCRSSLKDKAFLQSGTELPSHTGNSKQL